VEPRLRRPTGGLSTRAVHGATTTAVPQQSPVAPAIWPVATWGAERSSMLGELLDDERAGYVYGRYDNPTNTTLHTVVAALHGSEAAWSFASGTAAVHATLESLRAGGRILASTRIYGGTHAMLHRLADDAGWKVDRVDCSDLEALAAALTDEHTVVHVETIANPTTDLVDVAAVAGLAHAVGARLVVDNTFASPALCRPLELGADVVVESATKYIAGHGDVVAGVVAGPQDVVAAARTHSYELGSPLGPFEAWLVCRGVQTLPLRMQRICANAQAVAESLEAHDAAGDVRYPGLDSHPQRDLARRLLPDGCGGVVAFELGDRAAAERFADACRVFTRAASLGATRSLVLHPASTSHRQLSDEELRDAGVGPARLRLAVGIEDAPDLLDDLTRAFDASTSRDRQPPEEHP